MTTALERIEIMERELAELKKEARIDQRQADLDDHNKLKTIFALTPFPYSEFRYSNGTRKDMKLDIKSHPGDGSDSGVYSHGPSFKLIVSLCREILKLQVMLGVAKR